MVNAIREFQIAAIVVGVPYRHDEEKTEIINEINEFIKELKLRTELDVIEFDESYSTRRAVSSMLEAGRKKKHRSIKGNKDKIAAAIILRDFLNEVDNA